jgi:lipoyl(octanoyl) transferase
MRALHVRRLGLVEYEDGLAMQRLLARARAAGQGADTLLLLEHPRVITLGRAAKEANVLWNQVQLEARGFTVHATDRGGDVTYHGPGQVVGYPVLDLKPDRKDVRRYVRSVEELMIRAGRDFGVEAERVEGRAGIWVRGAMPALPGSDDPGWAKLGAIGVHLSRWVTTHGFALNVTTDLEDFRSIVPCGINDAWVCSLESLRAKLGQGGPAISEVQDKLAAHGGEVWESEPFDVPVELRTLSLTVIREGLHGDEILLMRRVPERGGFWQTLTGKIERGESPLAAAARELFEETGFSPRLEEIRELDYTHAFALDPALTGQDSLAPIFCRETAYALRVEPSAEPVLSPEHDAHRWVSLEDALPLLPFAGLKKAARRAVEMLRQI